MRVLAIVATLVFALAACSGSTPGAATPAGTTPADLGSLLPNEVNGIQLSKETLTAADTLGDDPSSASIREFLEGVGKAPTDLSFAVASATSISVVAFRLPGIDAARLQQAVVDSGIAANPGAAASTATVSGKQVTQVTGGGTTSYYYAYRDVVFGVDAETDELAQAAVAALP